MSMHPFFTEQLIADHQRKLVEQATHHRLFRQRTAPPTRRRRFSAVLRTVGQWVTPTSAGRRHRGGLRPNQA